MRATHADVEPVVVARRAVVFDGGLARVEIAAERTIDSA